MVHQQPAHRLVSKRQKLPTIFSGQLAILDEAEVALIDDRGRRERMAGPLVPHSLVRESSEVLVHIRDEFLPHGLIAIVVAAQ